MSGVLKGWTPAQRHAVVASYLGWTLDALDYFVLVFVLSDIAREFSAPLPAVAFSTMLTLALRPLGAFIFGRLADYYGRRPVLMLDIALYSLFGFATAFAPNLTTFLVIRALFGVAMGGVWGIGASLAFETIKPQARGLVSGLLQSGYPTGYLVASLVFGLLYGVIGWRGMFMVGFAPAVLLIAYMYFTVSESPAFNSSHARAASSFSVLRRHWKVALYAILLMTGFNFFSHGTQDSYPIFLQKQLGFSHHTVSTIAVIYNCGALLGGIVFGAISQRLGRVRAMIVAALLTVPMIYLWAFSTSAVMLAIGAFVMQFCVQGAWGVVPAHLNELSPPEARGTFPGTVYQLGNLIASVNLPLQTFIAVASGGDYRFALSGVVLGAALVIAICSWLGPEAHNVEMARLTPAQG